MRLEGQLDAFLAGIVYAGEADEMRGDFSAGVVAAEFAMLIDAFQAERSDRVRGTVGVLLCSAVGEHAGAAALEIGGGVLIDRGVADIDRIEWLR